MPAETRIVTLAEELLLVVDGVLLLPLGARVEVSDTSAVVVTGVRLLAGEHGTPRLVLQVEDEPSLERAAIQEAVAEAEVVAAAEEIAATEMSPDLD